MAFNSVWNHTRDKQIGLPLRVRPILSSLVWLQSELNSTQSYYHYLSSAPVKAGGPPVEELEGLSLKLGENWKKLGRRLGFDEAAITNFDHGNRKLADKAFEMLLAWKQREGLNAFYEVLYDALCHNFVQCKLLAEEFCCDKIIENVSP